jgi:hypothetical protein
VEINVRCSKCHRILDATVVEHEIVVDPCEVCLNKAYEKGFGKVGMKIRDALEELKARAGGRYCSVTYILSSGGGLSEDVSCSVYVDKGDDGQPVCAGTFRDALDKLF